jgi:hypothetical protein
MKYALLLRVGEDSSKRTVFLIATEEDDALDEASLYLTMVFTKDIDAVRSAKVVAFDSETLDMNGLREAVRRKQFKTAAFDVEGIREALQREED